MSLSSYNGHSNFTIRGKKFIKRGADNIYDIASVAGTSGNFSTGWVNTDGTTAVANGANLNFNHNLGTTDLVYNVYAAKDNSGTDAIDISNHEVSQTNVPRSDYGSQTLITSNTIQVVLGSHGLIVPDIGATYNVSNSNFTTYPYIKVVVSAGGGGGGFLYDFYVSQSSVTDKWNQTTTWYTINSANIRKLDSSMPDITDVDIFTARGATETYFNSNRWNVGGNSFATITINGVIYNMSCPMPGMGYILKGPAS